MQKTEVGLCHFVTLICRPAIPFQGFHVIPDYALPICVTSAEVVLSVCFALFHHFAIPFHGLCAVLRDAVASSSIASADAVWASA